MESNHQEEKLNSLDGEPMSETVLTEPTQEPQSPEPMEVHHHAHHDHGKKNWKTYFWEFFMLFLAVFCGFLAENFREHYVEEQRVERQLNIMVDNLRYDTTRIGRNQMANRFGITVLDSLRKEVMLIIQGKKEYSNFYRLREGLNVYGEPRFNSSAYTQLTTTGLLRLVKNDSLIIQVNDYYERVTYMVKSAVEAANLTSAKVNEQFNMLADQTSFNELISAFRASYPPLQDTAFDRLKEKVFATAQLRLVNSSPTELHKLYNDLVQLEVAIKILESRMDYAKSSAVKLMNEIEKTYH